MEEDIVYHLSFIYNLKALVVLFPTQTLLSIINPQENSNLT